MSEKRRVLFGAGYAFAGTIVALATAVLLRPLMVRYLGVGGYGVLVLATSLVSIASLATDPGFGGALTRFVAQEGNLIHRRELITSALIASLVTGSVSTAIVIAIAGSLTAAFQMPGLFALLVVLAWQVPFQLASTACLAAFNGLRRARAYGTGSAITSLVLFSFILIALVTGGGTVGVALGMIAAPAATFAILVVSLKPYLSLRSLREFMSTAKRLAGFGIQLSLVNAATAVLYQIDTTLLGFFTKSDLLVGYYAIAMVLSRMLWLIPGSISTVAYPAFSEYDQEKKQVRTEFLVDRALRFSTAIVGLVIIGLLFFGRDILSMLFGAEALPAYVPLVALLGGVGLLGITKSVVVGIAAIGRTDVGFRISVLGLCLSAVLNVAFIPSYGLLGAAAATSVAYGATGLLGLAYTQRLLAVPVPWRWLSKAAAWIGGFATVFPLSMAVFTGSPYIVPLVGGIVVVGYLLVFYHRLLPKEDTAFVVAAIRHALRRSGTP